MTPDIDDFIFRFKLDPTPSPNGGADPLTDMFQSFFIDFLQIGYLTCNGKCVTVDGFCFTNDTDTIHPLDPEKG